MSEEARLDHVAIYRKDRVRREVDVLRQTHGVLRVEDLIKVDQMNYLGASSLECAAQQLGIQAHHKLLDVGSGYGGPSRYLAWTRHCSVTALELQEQVHSYASQLTEEVGLTQHVHHVHGDITTIGFPADTFDFAFSILALLHIPSHAERAAALSAICTALKPDGVCWIEDFSCAPASVTDEVSAEEKKALAEVVGCSFLPSQEQYEKMFHEAGFRHVEFIDLSEQWTSFCLERSQAFVANKERHIAVHGEDLYHSLALFYSTVADSFQRGFLRGCRVISRK
eukprot:TRINITY_DN8019_c0_g1_i3.p1 TRINITY_DN8019_c0_g1~~TRINITY_DN8019_c0_g1_i3.p1  ORF type:complete len:282 (+),score=52.95 TRINITY_DN8019_c0_g1_i3:82-927(+)